MTRAMVSTRSSVAARKNSADVGGNEKAESKVEARDSEKGAMGVAGKGVTKKRGRSKRDEVSKLVSGEGDAGSGATKKRGTRKRRGPAKVESGKEGNVENGLPEDEEEQEYEETVCSVPKGRAGSGIVKIVSWNVASLRSALKNGALEEYVAEEMADIVCLQEHKLKEEDTAGIEDEAESIFEDYESYWSCSTAKKGYSGTAVFTREKPLSVSYGIGESVGDLEGRAITLEMDKYYLVNLYVPNSGAKLVRLEYRIDNWQARMVAYLKDLEKKKPVILCGDLNCAHQEIDIHAPKRNRKSAGFTDEERKAFSEMLDTGFVDTLRSLYPKKRAYTYWSMRFGKKTREGNKGWRLDYFVVSRDFMPKVKDSFVRYETKGSDHAPVGLLVELD